MITSKRKPVRNSVNKGTTCKSTSFQQGDSVISSKTEFDQANCPTIARMFAAVYNGPFQSLEGLVKSIESTEKSIFEFELSWKGSNEGRPDDVLGWAWMTSSEEALLWLCQKAINESVKTRFFYNALSLYELERDEKSTAFQLLTKVVKLLASDNARLHARQFLENKRHSILGPRVQDVFVTAAEQEIARSEQAELLAIVADSDSNSGDMQKRTSMSL